MTNRRISILSQVPLSESQFGKKESNIKGPSLRTKKDINSLNSKDQKKIDLFKLLPTKKSYENRKLPKELIGKPRIIGHETQIKILYTYTKSIAKEFFNSSIYLIFFPKNFIPEKNTRLSILSTTSRDSTSSHIPIFRKSSIAFDFDLESDFDQTTVDLSKAFSYLENIISTTPKKAIALTDFYILYLSLVIAINEKLYLSKAIDVINLFFTLPLEKINETNILFAVFLRIDLNVSKRSEIISILNKLTKFDSTIIERLQNGSTHKDQNISSLCLEVLNSIGIISKNINNSFINLKDNFDENSAIESLNKFIDKIEDNSQPEDFLEFIKNIIDIMIRFPTSSIILERSTNCLIFVLNDCPNLPIPADILTECLLLCYSIQSSEIFLSGDLCFEAQESIKQFLEISFINVNSIQLINTYCALISQSNGNKLETIITFLNDNLKKTKFSNDQLQLLSKSLIKPINPSASVEEDTPYFSLNCIFIICGSVVPIVGSSKIVKPKYSVSSSGLGTLIKASIAPIDGIKSGMNGLK